MKLRRICGYCGGNVGLMGVVANAVLERGGEVIGVITDGLVKREVAHLGLTELRVVSTMHERKAIMADLSDAFIAMPGGFGTMDELFEILTWSQLGLHGKPIGILNPDGYYYGLLTFLSSMERAGFVRAEHSSLLHSAASIPELMAKLENAPAAPQVGKWI